MKVSIVGILGVVTWQSGSSATPFINVPEEPKISDDNDLDVCSYSSSLRVRKVMDEKLSSKASRKLDDSNSVKSSWPECISERLTCEECKNHITRENNTDINLITIEQCGESSNTFDARTDRVWIYCNGTAVTDIPMIM